MKKLLFLTVALLQVILAQSQGCVPVRNYAGMSPDILFNNVKPQDKLVFSFVNRYYDASDSYKGDKFIADTLVTNRVYTMTFSLLKLFRGGWSMAVIIPISANSRDNGADHKGPGTLPRYTTHSFGLGDIRLAVYKWLFKAAPGQKGNVQLGLGVKLATGDFRFEDYFVRNDSTTVLAPVDQAIQLGDGGTGITGDLNAFYMFSHSFHVFAQAFYLANPREQNGVSNLKGRNATQTEIKNNTTVMSVPDQFTLRGGMSYEMQKFAFTAGLRYDKVPVNDLMGGNKGFRRAAYIASAEGGITYKMSNVLVFAQVGVPFKRNIIQNWQNNMTPAGFAKLILYAGISIKL